MLYALRFAYFFSTLPIMSSWIKVAKRNDLSEGQMIQVEVNTQLIVLALYESKLHAFAAHCPHASANLVEGDLRPGYLICPLHAYRFDLKSGICLKPRDGPHLRMYEAAFHGEEIWVKVG
ncbi:MAG: Rieske (2Fe-2S) protein [Chloroflexota bacterium]|nr:Rieske (2Fe-2S) protein [Chloroflexota bacterium]